MQRYRFATAETTVKRVKLLMKRLQLNFEEFTEEQEKVLNYITQLNNVSHGYKHNLLLAYVRFLRYADKPINRSIFEALRILDRLRERRLAKIPSYSTCLAGLAALRGRAKIAYALALYAGLRLGEALALRWYQVDLEKHLIVIEQSEKRSEASILSIPDELAALLSRYRINAKPDDPVVGLTQKGVRAAIARLRKRISAPDAELINMKNLRHVYATRLYTRTHDLVYVQRMLRHRSILTTQRYVHLTAEPKTYETRTIDINDKDTIAELIADGFEVALNAKNYVILRRAKI
ncbi:MAG: tyrosine-type recombinase/integrase [Nitrososphaerota archaeon]